MDDQAECYRRLEQAFLRHATDENEKLTAIWDPKSKEWRFEGSGFASRTFTALACDARAESAGESSGHDLRDEWLRALRMNEVQAVGPDSTIVRFVDYDMAATMLVPLPVRLDRLFSRSAIFCLEWATEMSSRMRFFEQMTRDESEDQSGQQGYTALYGTSAPELDSLLAGVFGASSVHDIETALEDGRRKDAAFHWAAMRRSKGLKATKAALYAEAAQDKAEYYRWERGELSRESQAARDIEKVLFRTVD